MNFKILLITLILFSCSSRKEIANKEIRNSSFKVNNRVSQNEFNDYLIQDSKKLGHLFLDESSEFSTDHSVLVKNNDELVDLSFLCRNNKRKEATNLIKELNRRLKKIPAFWNTVAACYIEFKEYRKALLFLNQSLDLSPDYPPALNNLGIYYLRQGLDQKALLAFERSLNASKFSRIPRFNLVKIFLKHGLVDLSRPLLVSLLSDNSSDNQLLELLAYQKLFEGDYKKSLDIFLDLKAKNHHNTETLLAISFNFLQLKDLEKAKSFLTKIDVKRITENQKFFYNYMSTYKGVIK